MGCGLKQNRTHYGGNMGQSRCASCGKFIGRLLLSAIFLISGVGKLLAYDATAAYMKEAGLTMIPLLLIAAAAVEILGGLSLFLGLRARLGAAVLILYLIAVTALFHNFWDLEGAVRQLQLIEFLKNLAIIGGLFYVASSGAGCLAVTKCCKESCTKEGEKH